MLKRMILRRRTKSCMRMIMIRRSATSRLSRRVLCLRCRRHAGEPAPPLEEEEEEVEVGHRRILSAASPHLNSSRTRRPTALLPNLATPSTRSRIRITILTSHLKLLRRLRMAGAEAAIKQSAAGGAGGAR